ncbi:6-carboxytetrahydropterin synthase QueD [Arcticibacter sp.]|jgi:6-pyruvoyltetrahydropterin/6-carboxytetrahydropterin synthase|uniref:6-carboxytetrahydropterin synthase QueD n=1 Tax=Arcticibacter sp. TaxID=1872630 RepID=UPI00388D36C6
MVIYKQFSFDSAHFLPYVSENHKCGRMHGHTYTLTVFLEGDVDPLTGWLVDFTDLKDAVDPLVKSLDHRLLNEIPGLENPTSERLAEWFWIKIKPLMPLLSKIEINETPTSGVIYTG